MRMAGAVIGLAGGLLVFASTLLWKSRADVSDRNEAGPGPRAEVSSRDQAGTSRPIRPSGLSPLDMTAETYSRWGAVLAKFRPGPDPEPAALAHYLRLWAGTADSPAADDPSYSLAGRLLDDRTCLHPELPKQKVLRRHSRGIRYELNIPASTPGLPPIIAGEAHVGQCLGALGEAGISPDREVLVDGRTYHVRDLIDDVAWCYYLRRGDRVADGRPGALPPARWPSGATKYGRHVSWAMITDEFVNLWLRRKMSGHACAGTHTLYVLALLTKVDAVHPLWSSRDAPRLTAASARRPICWRSPNVPTATGTPPGPSRTRRRRPPTP